MRKEVVAHHEAGHAVAAFLYHFKIDFATIKSDGDAAGMVRCYPRGKMDLYSASPIMRNKIERNIIVTLAGDIAQRKFAPRSSRSWQLTADRSAASNMALSVCGTGESATAYLAWLYIVARDQVHGRWNLVERVASALLDRETLSGDDLRHVILPGRITSSAAA